MRGAESHGLSEISERSSSCTELGASELRTGLVGGEAGGAGGDR